MFWRCYFMDKLKLKGKHEKNRLKKGIGFYLVLSLCLVSVAIAAVITYSNLKSFMSDNEADKPLSTIHKEYPKRKEESKSSLNFFESSEDSESEGYTTPSLIDNDSEDEQAVAAEAKASGTIVNPVGKEVIKKYSLDTPVFSKTFNDWRVHSGVDLKADKGGTVKAITDGTVKDIVEDPILGKTMSIEHSGGFVAYYSGLGDTTMVNTGETVESGQEIGSVGDIPGEISDGCHLHLAIKRDDCFIDPSEVLGDLN